MSTYKVQTLTPEKTLLGEGPHWDASTNILYFVDLMGSSVRSYNPESGKSTKVTIDGECLGERAVSLVIPIAGSSNQFIISYGRSLKRLEWDTLSEKPTTLSTIYDSTENNNLEGRFNDGKCDSSGRLWAGTMPIYRANPSPEELTRGILHKLNSDGYVSKELFDVGISNGLAWSADNKTFYFIDSYTRRVDAFDYDALSGKIGNRRTVFDLEKENEKGYPDGMAIDVNGNLWVACFDGSKVIQINPTLGKVIGRIEFPTRHITSVTFGGQNLDELYVTSSKYYMTPEELAAEPEAGALFKVTNIGTRGLSAGISYSAI